MFAQAWALHNQGRLEESRILYEQLLQVQPDHFDALHMLGVLAVQMGRTADGVALMSRAISINAHHAAAHYNLGVAFKALGQLESALRSYAFAIALQGDYVDALYNRSVVLQELERWQDALASYREVLAIEPRHAPAHLNRGNVLRQLGQLDAALCCHDAAIALLPNDPAAHYNRGVVLQDLMLYTAALASYDRAIALGAGFAEVFYNRGNTLQALHLHREAVLSFDQAIALKPDEVGMHVNRGNSLQAVQLYPAAQTSYGRALMLQPDFEFLAGLRLHMKMQVCDWGNFESECALQVSRLERDEKVAPPFCILALTSSLALQKKAALAWVQTKCPSSDLLSPFCKRPQGKKIRIGYFSADFYAHATAHLTAGLFEKHDKSRFEIFAFSWGSGPNDAVRQRLVAAFDAFVDVEKRSDREVAMLARVLEIDIAVDLKGFTTHARPGIFAMRAAPIQVNYLGYPGTMAASYMDYVLADRVVIPESSRSFYSEKIAYLPGSYQVNDDQRVISDRVFTRAELGLPPAGFVFACFNSNYKISPAIFDVWMRLLQRVDGSVLWLFESHADAARNLRHEAMSRGVDAERLVFAKPMPVAEHLARHRLADVCLDTLPCNAHTTASDALWAGLPVLTCMGESFASRVAASLLYAVELPELVTSRLEDFEALAIELALHPYQLKAIREKLAQKRLTAALFSTLQSTRNLEAAFAKMFERHLADLPPRNFSV